jgi:hypothetical protein
VTGREEFAEGRRRVGDPGVNDEERWQSARGVWESLFLICWHAGGSRLWTVSKDSDDDHTVAQLKLKLIIINKPRHWPREPRHREAGPLGRRL